MSTEAELEPREGASPRGHAVLDGPTLRELRRHHDVPLRAVARQGKLSHGHLSKVERGEPGRPVTPGVLAAYEKAMGMRLADAGGPGGWQPGQLTPNTLRAFTSRVAAVAFGGAMDNLDRVLDASGRLYLDEPLHEDEVAQLQEIADHLAGREGLMAGIAARTLLRWLVRHLDELPVEPRQQKRPYAVVAALGRRAAHAGEQLGAHEVARSLYLVALHAAAVADHPGLRGLILADLAAQHDRVGHHDGAQAIARIGEADERLPDQVRTRLHEVKATAAEAEARVHAQVQQAMAKDTKS